MKKVLTIGTVLALAMVLAAAPAFAGGFRIPEQGAKAMGLANAFVGLADDPSAVQFNPAGLVQVPGNQIQAGLTQITVKSAYTDTAGAGSDMEDTVAVPPTFYYTNHLGEGPWWIGLGITSPFGLASDWDVDTFKYIATKTSLEMVKVNPAVGYKVNDKVSVGGGVDYYQVLEATFENLVPYGPIPSPLTSYVPANQKLSADGTSYGWNVGVLYRGSETVSVGFCYRSGAEVDLSGDVSVTPSAALPVRKGDGETTLKLPATAALGVAWKVAPQWGINLDLDWTGWSAYDELDIRTDLGNSVTPKDYKDTTAFRVGAAFQLNADWNLRGGFLLDSTPVPEKNYDARLPDGDRWGASLGTGYRKGPWSVDFAYMYVKVKKMEVDNDIEDAKPYYSLLPFMIAGTPAQSADGSYEGSINLIGLNVGYAF